MVRRSVGWALQSLAAQLVLWGQAMRLQFSTHYSNDLEFFFMRLKTKRIQAFTLVEIMIVVAIIGLLAAIAIPNMVKARNTAQANACINNMRQIDNAIQSFALENNKKDSDAVTDNDVRVYIKGSVMPTCPAGNTAYVLGGTVASAPSVTCPNAASTPPHKLGP